MKVSVTFSKDCDLSVLFGLRLLLLFRDKSRRGRKVRVLLVNLWECEQEVLMRQL